ncbi:MAG: DNA polymerase II, partial [Candidatus Methanomethylophilaceae archaeon]|nr:DNA polymerase II [Candidatus Methanomethylophilaceae archaeon]
VSWVVTDSKKTPQVVEPYVSGKPFVGEPDYRYYAERIAQTASRITDVFGWNEKDLMVGSQQATLFGGDFESRSSSSSGDAPKSGKSKPRMTKLSDFF